MPARSRPLTVEDVGALLAISAENAERAAVYQAVEAVAAETCGFVFLTTLRYDEAAGVVRRLHSSNEDAYPLGGTKPLSRITKSHSAMQSGDVFLAGTREAVREAFFDHELIFSLGSTAIMNAPIRNGGRRLGTLNFCGLEGQYGEAEIAAAKTLAGLLVPCLLAEAAAAEDQA